MSSLIRPETVKAHKATWWVYAGPDRIRRTAQMRGQWGHDVTCSCGWDSRTGGGTKGYVTEALFDHRYEAQTEADRKAGR